MVANPAHRPNKDRIIQAWLHGASSRWAETNGWHGPDGDQREKAIAELREIATVGRRLRTDLLAHVAGTCLGASRLDGIHAQSRAGAARLLLELLDGAEAELVEQVAAETHARLSSGRVGEPRFAQVRDGQPVTCSP